MTPSFDETLVFEAGTEGYPGYRIPSLIKAPNGDLLAFAEGRFQGDHDNADIVMKRSTDNGETWSDLEVIWGDQYTDGTTIGNPSPVVDELTGTIWLPAIQDQFEVLLFNSTDNGNTWSGPVNISDRVKNPDFPFGPEPTNADEERIIWTGPGTGIQIQNGPHAGRLVIPAHFQPFPNGPDEEGAGVENNEMWVFYSDDHGESWESGDSSVLGNESQVVELSNNDLLLNGRNENGLGLQTDGSRFRLNATSSDGGANFTDSVLDDELIDPVVQASIFRYSFGGSGEDNILLFSNPVSSSDADYPFRTRENLTVRLSYDDGQTWPIDRLIDPGDSGYSSLTRQANNNIGLLYEGLSSDADPSLDTANNISFASFNLEWLTEESSNPPDAVNNDSPEDSVLLFDWEDIEGWNSGGAESDSDISIIETGELRLFDNAETTTKVFRSDVDITGAYSLEFQAQAERYTTDDKVSLGVKVQDGNFRLMFQRKSDGFYVIDDSNTWVKLPDSDGNFQPEFKESQEYKIDVDNGIGVLSTRASGAADYVVEGEWNLQPFQQHDLVEHWVRGTIESPAEARWDMTSIF